MAHHDSDIDRVSCAVVTISDTRTQENDTSGQRIKSLLEKAGHVVAAQTIIPDEPHHVRLYLKRLAESAQCQAALISGGTGLSPRDSTYEAVSAIMDRQISGFGELFRQLSYQEVGADAMLSRAVAGTCGRMIVYSMPGSTPAVELAMTKLILPTLVHAVTLIRNR